MKDINIFKGFYTFEDKYRGELRLSVCAHGIYDKDSRMGYVLIPTDNKKITTMTYMELSEQLIKKGMKMNNFKYIRLILCDSATSEKDISGSDLDSEKSFASQFSTLYPNCIVISYVGPVKARHNYFNPDTLSYQHKKGVQRNKEIFSLNNIFMLHFGEYAQNQRALSAFNAEKERYSKEETIEPITPIPFLRPKNPRKPISHVDADLTEYVSVWFRNGKRIISEMVITSFRS
ncbi:hypothetical protein [Xenorhabdus bharatensis]|uniref:hypothetical protein n=1 Tax=Xenorhabdus bharatensis TaxID=3136256 RepID=UPI0030F42F1A